MIDIIIARYNEDLNWLLESPFNQFKYIVYNKGDNINFCKQNVKEIITLPNLGKCDHTYLYHIVNNYDNLAEILVFFPGSIQMHHKKEKAIKLLRRIIAYKKAAILGNYCRNLPTQFHNFSLDTWETSDANNRSNQIDTTLRPCRIRPYQRWYKYYFGNLKIVFVCMHGIFSISKRDVKKYKVTRYQNLLNQLSFPNPEVGHYIERSWVAIFGPILHTNLIT